MTVTDSDPLTDSQDIAVTATDVAAEAPTITSSASVSVAENQTAVINVASTDPDGDTEGAGLTYTLSGGADQALFSIHAGTGVLSFTSAPDYEAAGDTGTDNDYEVTVTVTDSAALTDSQDITVTVTDVSDNTAPTITSDGGGDIAGVDAAENQTAVTDVQSTDDADSEGSGLVYSISGGADQALFSIDAASGVLTFDSAPDSRRRPMPTPTTTTRSPSPSPTPQP